MAHAITIDAAVEGLNQFVNVFGDKIHETLRTGLEWESILPFVQTDYAYTGQDTVTGQVLQPYQDAYTPTNTETFSGITSFLTPMKSDLSYTSEQLRKFFSKWRASWWNPDPAKIKGTYFQYLLQNHILPKLMEDRNRAAWAGEYVEPTPGTPGAMLESIDGFKVNLETHISDGLITPITVGALVPSSMVDIVREFCDALPEPYRYQTGEILMNTTHAQRYADDYSIKYPTRKVNEEEQNKLYLRVDHYNKYIRGMTSMAGSDRFIIRFPNLDSMIIGERTGFPREFDFRFEVEDRKLKVFGEIYRFYNWETMTHCFVSDNE